MDEKYTYSNELISKRTSQYLLDDTYGIHHKISRRLAFVNHSRRRKIDDCPRRICHVLNWFESRRMKEKYQITYYHARTVILCTRTHFIAKLLRRDRFYMIICTYKTSSYCASMDDVQIHFGFESRPWHLPILFRANNHMTISQVSWSTIKNYCKSLMTDEVIREVHFKSIYCI